MVQATSTTDQAHDGGIGCWRYRLLMACDELLDSVGRRLSEAASSPARVILFGSHARGEGRPDSDLDLLVIEPSFASRRDEFVRLRRALGGIGVAVDLVLVDEDHVAKWRDVRGTLIHEALHTGRVLAAA